MQIFLRSETYASDSRTAIVPSDLPWLISHGFTVIVESSETRAFSDTEYIEAGAVLTKDKWYDQDPTTLIIGLKELDKLYRLNGHSHVYFAHCYKAQAAAPKILMAFKVTNSRLYDLEYFYEPDGSRALAFGYYAGLVGASLGLTQLYSQRNKLGDIHDLKPWTSFDQMLAAIKPIAGPISIGIVGNGRCSKGVQAILNHIKQDLDYEILDRNDDVSPDKYDILFNCILLDPSYKKVWIKNETRSKPVLVVDLSCDYTKPNDPIGLTPNGTSWQTPVFQASDALSVIAIDNLPSLLPRDSSVDFSKKMTDLLLEFGNQSWTDNLRLFYEKTLETIG